MSSVGYESYHHASHALGHRLWERAQTPVSKPQPIVIHQAMNFGPENQLTLVIHKPLSVSSLRVLVMSESTASRRWEADVHERLIRRCSTDASVETAVTTQRDGGLLVEAVGPIGRFSIRLSSKGRTHDEWAVATDEPFVDGNFGQAPILKLCRLITMPCD